MRQKIIIIFFFLFIFNTFTYSQTNSFSQNTNKIIIENEDDSFIQFQMAMYYKEKAIEIIKQDGTNTISTQAKDNIEKSKVILLDLINTNAQKEVYYTLAELYDISMDTENSIKTYSMVLKEYPNDETSLYEIAKRYWMLTYNKLVSVKTNDDLKYFQNYLNQTLFYFNKTLEVNKNNTEARFLFGYILFITENFTEASYQFKYLLEDTSSNYNNLYRIYIKYYLGVSQFYINQFKNASENLLSISVDDLKDEEIMIYYNCLIKSLQAIEDYDASYAAAKKSYEIYKDYDILYLTLLLSYLSDNFNEELYKKINDIDGAKPRIIEYIEIEKNNSKAQALEAIGIDIKQGRYNLDILQMYYKIITDDAATKTQKELIETEYLLLTFYDAMGLPESMVKHIEHLSQYDKKYNSMYLNVASKFYENGEYNKANETLEKYLSLGDSSVYTESELEMAISIAYETKNIDTAIKLYEQLEKITDDIISVKLNKAYFYSMIKDSENVRLILNDLYSDKEKLEDIDINTLMVGSFAAVNIRDKKLSLEYNEFIYNLYPDDYAVINNLAWALIELDINVPMGIRYIEEYLSDNLDDPNYLDTLAWGYYKQRNFETARLLLLKSLKNLDNDYQRYNIYSHLADVYYELGAINLALKYYEEAYKLKDVANYTDAFDEEYIRQKIEETKYLININESY